MGTMNLSLQEGHRGTFWHLAREGESAHLTRSWPCPGV